MVAEFLDSVRHGSGRERLIIFVKNFFGYFRRRNYYGGDFPELEGDYGAMDLGELCECLVRLRSELQNVPDDRERSRTWWKLPGRF